MTLGLTLPTPRITSLFSKSFKLPFSVGSIYDIIYVLRSRYKAEVLEAIQSGVLTWTAFPFNSELAAYLLRGICMSSKSLLSSTKHRNVFTQQHNNTEIQLACHRVSSMCDTYIPLEQV